MKKYNHTYTSDLIQMEKTDRNGSETRMINYEEYNNIVDAIPFMRNLGGTETVRLEKYSRYGYNLVRYIKSTSPDGTQSVIYRFKL